jgi:uncharacterized protein (TIGR00369 family)
VGFTVHIKDLRSLVDKMAFNKLLGIHVLRYHSDGLTVECSVREELLNSAGVLHGGVLATVADAAVGIALARHFGGKRPMTTIELKINYLRPVAHGKVLARARLLKVGTTICVGRVDVKDSAGKIVGAALVSYMLLRTER